MDDLTEKLPQTSNEHRLLEWPIRTYQSVDAPVEYLAMIGPLPFIFRDTSPMRAVRKAEDWRAEQYDRLTGPEKKRSDAAAVAVLRAIKEGDHD